MRLVVQTSPTTPKAGAPLARAARNCARWSPLKRGAEPGEMRPCRRATPPALLRLTHWLTAG